MSRTDRDLAREINRLLDRVRSWSPTSWEVMIGAGGTRAQRAIRLVDELAALGRQAGSGAPPEATPPRLAPHVLADQITVLADDLLETLDVGAVPPADRHHVCVQACEAVAAARRDLDPAGGFGFAFAPSPRRRS
jgi:hypothetical protein